MVFPRTFVVGMGSHMTMYISGLCVKGLIAYSDMGACPAKLHSLSVSSLTSCGLSDSSFFSDLLIVAGLSLDRDP